MRFLKRKLRAATLGLALALPLLAAAQQLPTATPERSACRASACRCSATC